MIKKALILWLALFVPGQILFWYRDGFYLRRPGIYLSDAYRGLLFSDLLYSHHPHYARAVALAYHAGSLALLPVIAYLWRRHAAFTRDRDYAGNIVGPAEWRRILRNHARFKAVKQWRIPLRHRNQVFVGVDLISGRHVFLEGEALFTGILIIGKQGTGKTQSFFKTILKQLAMDPLGKTSFAVFTLKEEDSRSFSRYLAGLGHRVMPWSMCNVLSLALDRSGGLEQGRLQALLQAAALATGMGNAHDPFWLNSAVRRLVEHVFALSKAGRYITWGHAYQRFKEAVAAKGDDAKMEQGLFETLNAAFGAMLDPSSRLAVLHAPHQDGGLHWGPLWAAPGAEIRRITPSGIRKIRTGRQAQFFPPGLYEIPASVRLPFDWNALLQPLSVTLPAPGASKGEQLALNFIKLTLLHWIADDMADPRSRLLKTDPAERFRIVLAQDEYHNFLALGGEGMTDIKALQEHRQAGLVNLGASQSMTAMMKGTRQQNDAFFSVNGTFLFLGVNGPERRRVLDVIGKVKVKRIERSFGRSEGAGGKTTGVSGQIKTQNTQASVNERVTELEQDFISLERYGQLPQGTAIMVTQGRHHRVVYCPLHDRLQFTYQGRERAS